jgi:hypothetical protein
VQDERRASPRFLIECDVRYRIVGGSVSKPLGVGRTVNMSSGGLLFTTERLLSPGLRVEIEMDWPVERDEGVTQKLIIMGQIVRSETRTVSLAGVKISRHAFQTAR